MYTRGGPGPGQFPPIGVSYLIEGRGGNSFLGFFFSTCYHYQKMIYKDTDSS